MKAQERPQPSKPRESKEVRESREPRTTKVLVIQSESTFFVNLMIDMGKIKRSIRKQKAWFLLSGTMVFVKFAISVNLCKNGKVLFYCWQTTQCT